MYSLFAFLITDVLPIDVSVVSPLAEGDLLLCAIFGGVLSGIGSGMVIRFGGAIDGIEVLSVIFSKVNSSPNGTVLFVGSDYHISIVSDFDNDIYKLVCEENY